MGATQGSAVSVALAETLAAYNGAVNLISDTLATCQAEVYATRGGDRERVTSHPVVDLIEAGANDLDSFADVIRFATADCLNRGNALIEIESASGRVMALKPVPWAWVMPVMLTTGSLAFDVIGSPQLWGPRATPRRLLLSDVAYVRDRSDNGIVGRSRLARAAPAVAVALAQQEIAGAVSKNGLRPSGTISVAAKMQPDAVARLRATIREQNGGGRTPASRSFSTTAWSTSKAHSRRRILN
jgi:HK97 family phage portal protein